MAKKRSLFDDRPQEIQELTYIIREDITNLNKQIAHLQGFMKKQQNQQQNTRAHSANVVVALQSKLATMSSEFKQILEVRTEVGFFFYFPAFVCNALRLCYFWVPFFPIKSF